MRRILLVSNKVLPYRIGVYNDFSERFSRAGYEFHVLSNKIDKVPEVPVLFSHKEMPFNICKYMSFVDSLNPLCVLLFLHLKDRVQIPLVLHCNRKDIPVIYWNKGLCHDGREFKKANPLWKQAIYHYIHNRCDACITYSERLKRDYQEKTWDKLFVAPNTVSFEGIDRNVYWHDQTVRERYKIPQEDKVVLFAGTLDKRHKRPDLLLQALGGMRGCSIIFMGRCEDAEIRADIDKTPNAHYVGSIYGEASYAVWGATDILSIPGSLGLAANEAMFWNTPVVFVGGVHPPEADCIKDGYNGIIATGDSDYTEKLRELVFNQTRLKEMSANCQRVYENEISMDKMFDGFMDAINYVSNM